MKSGINNIDGTCPSVDTKDQELRRFYLKLRRIKDTYVHITDKLFTEECGTPENIR